MRMSKQPPLMARRHFLITSALLGTSGLLLPTVAHAGTTPPPPAGSPSLVPAATSTASEAVVADAVLIEAAALPSGAGDSAIRPFRYRASDGELADLKRRVAATRWPERETV